MSKNIEVLLIEPPPTDAGGNLRILGSTGALKARMCWPPLDLMIVAGALRTKGITFEILDAHALRLGFAETKARIAQIKPRAVVFSTSTSTLKDDMQVASIAKQAVGSCLTIAFGIHITALPRETLQDYPELDIAVYSEPESAIPSLALKGFEPEKSLGVWYRKKGELFFSLPHPACINRDNLGFPAHDTIPLRLYHDPHMHRGPLSMTLAQQGCVNNCLYCVCPEFYGKLNARSAAHVLEELAWAQSLGIREMRFFDSGLTHKRAWIGELLDGMLRSKVKLQWACNSRADCLDIELCRQMKACGCHTVWIGCESADEDVLKNAGKNETPEEVERAVSAARGAGLRTQVYFILGLPGETKASMEKTIRFALGLNPDIVTFNIANPQPGTRLYRYLMEKKYLKTLDWSCYSPTLPPVYDYPDLKSEEIYATMKSAYRRFYLRPSYITRRMLNMRSWLEIKNNVRIFQDFLRRY